MKLTNKRNIPQAIIDAIMNDGYSKQGSDYSATELLSPPRKRMLSIKHDHEMTEDVQDRWFSFQGRIAHYMLEKANRSGLVEARFFSEFAGFSVSAQIDSLDLDSGVLRDYKYTSVYKLKKFELDPSWEAQLNIQAELLRRSGHIVNELEIVGLSRDFSVTKSKSNPDLPEYPIVQVHVPMWEREKTVAFIEERIKLHEAAKTELPLCTPEERWEESPVFAVLKKGMKRAVRLFEKEAPAKELAEAAGPNHSVVFRRGKSNRCENYCPASKFCSQYQESLKMPDSQEQD